MNFLFVSPHFPPNYRNFCAALKREGCTVLGLGDGKFSCFDPELKAALDWYCQVDDMHNYDELVRACGFLTGRFGKLDRIESLNEYWLSTDAKLRHDFNVFGVKPENIPFIRHKSEMKKIFALCGVAHARGRLVPDLASAQSLAAELGYPVVIKPDDGVGANMAFRVESAARLEELWPLTAGRHFIMEECLHGDICTFDGLTDRDGNIIFCTSHNYGQSPMDMLHYDGDISYYSVREIPADLEAAGRALVAGFGVKERFFHMEFFRRKDGSLCAMEVNMRPPGGMTMDMFNFACDFDLYGIWAALVAHGKADFAWSRKYFCAYASRKDTRRYLHSHDDALAHCGMMAAYHGPMPQAFSRYMGSYGYILRSPELPQLLEALDYLQKTV
ncbi:MAG: ATP-grasp domain-containing protein [Elusimicrobiales bacterium]|nr:ATP-grasp domain-containing protein [Elusimicrobiales bacterium]